jgi:hypothetical protein
LLLSGHPEVTYKTSLSHFRYLSSNQQLIIRNILYALRTG